MVKLQSKLFLPRLVFVSLVLLILFHPKVWAADFSSSYQVTYDFSDDGLASVTQKITLVNHTTDKYPADFSLLAKNLNIEEISASDSLGPLKIENTTSDDGKDNQIKVFFNQKLTGWGSRLTWQLNFKALSLAKKNGRMWEVNIPLLSGGTDVDNYAVTVKIPQTFGPEHFVKPADFNKSTDSAGKIIYQFNNRTIGQFNNLSLSFGDFQLYNFTLTYHLQNPTAQVVATEIALPPDFYPYQRVYFKSLEPKPLKIREDPDGNYLAEYKLRPQQKLEIVYQGQIKISAVSPASLGTSPTYSSQSYLLPAKFWEVNDEKISNLKSQISNRYKLDEKNSQTEWARAIYDYVTTTLKYNPARITNEVERFGAIKALEETQNAVCMEYTDLMITLLRAAGIPARELDGFAMTEKGPEKPLLADSLHSWVQYFDELGTNWRNTDPTWGSTTGQDFFSTLDTNHSIFVIKGLDSERPYPAGSYKITGDEQGDVKIEYTQSFEKSVIPFRLWWQENFERREIFLLDKIYLWLSNLIRDLSH